MWSLGRTRVITEASKTIRRERPLIWGSDGEGIRMWHVSYGEMFHLMSHQKSFTKRKEPQIASGAMCPKDRPLVDIFWSCTRLLANWPQKLPMPHNDINFHWKPLPACVIISRISWKKMPISKHSQKKTCCIDINGPQTSPEKNTYMHKNCECSFFIGAYNTCVMTGNILPNESWSQVQRLQRHLVISSLLKAWIHGDT